MSPHSILLEAAHFLKELLDKKNQPMYLKGAHCTYLDPKCDVVRMAIM